MLYDIEKLREEQKDFWYLELRRELQNLLQDDAPRINKVAQEVVVENKDFLPDMDVKEFVREIRDYLDYEENSDQALAVFDRIMIDIMEVFNNYLNRIKNIDEMLSIGLLADLTTETQKVMGKIIALADSEDLEGILYDVFSPIETPQDVMEFTAEDVLDIVRDRIKETEVIYCDVVREYLMGKDNSLAEALEIAEEYGYTPANLNSETLATLLKRRNLETELNEIEDEITELWENLRENIEKVFDELEID